MNINMKKRFALISFVFIFVLIGCNIKQSGAINIKQTREFQHKEILLEKVNQSDDECYTIYTSKLMDTYLIACALYFDFDTPNMIEDNNTLYQQVKEHFSLYKNHLFVKSLENYVDTEYRDSNPWVISSIIMYMCSTELENKEVNQLQNPVFHNYEAFKEFLNDLTQFYKDTNAEKFFDTNKKYELKMYKEIEEKIKSIPVAALIQTMESYVGNKERYYENQNVKYISLITLYRPSGASFYPIRLKDSTYFVSYQSIFQEPSNIESFDIDRCVETAIHEYLHMYINPPVEEQKQLIDRLATGKDKIIYGGKMYQHMDWHRITDENIVRAVEARIYGEVYNNTNRAYEEVLKKEVEWGGFTKVRNIYEILDEYEDNRKQYLSINAYIPKLIEELFK